MADAIITSLVELGFSEYEARTYSGLVGRAPKTGYAVAKQTGVPQPKVYETLNRLSSRGAVVQVGESPATWVAIPPSRLLSQLESDFRLRLVDAELQLSRVQQAEEEPDRVRPFWEASSWPTIKGVAEEMIEGADTRLYISAHSDQLDQLAEAVLAADRRQVSIDVLCFGDPPLALDNGEVVGHRSTEGMVYPHHQARHLALASDGAASLWALARTGSDWAAIWADDDDLLPAVVKGFIRHDLFVQRIYRDFEDELHDAYGPGLERLVHPEPQPTTPVAEDDENVTDATGGDSARTA